VVRGSNPAAPPILFLEAYDKHPITKYSTCPLISVHAIMEPMEFLVHLNIKPSTRNIIVTWMGLTVPPLGERTKCNSPKAGTTVL